MGLSTSYPQPLTITSLLQVRVQRQTAQTFTLAQSIQINLKTGPNYTKTVQIIPKEKIQSMKIKQKIIASFPCIFPKDKKLESMSQSQEIK